MRKLLKKMIGMTAGILGMWLLVCFTSAAASAEVVDGHTIVPVAAAMVSPQDVRANVRSGPSQAYPVIGVLEKGQAVNVCGQADTGWYQIVYGNGIGYVSSTLLVQVPVEESMLAALIEQAAFVKQQSAGQTAALAAQQQAAALAAQQQAAALAAQQQAAALAAQQQAAALAAQQAANLQGGNVIFVGDSRTGQMGNAVGGSAAFPGVAFVSCYGGGNAWLSSSVAKADIDKFVTPGSIIVINYGVNDLGKHEEYITTINKYAADWQKKGAVVFFASVGPVGENEYGKRNWSVEYFNNQLNNRLSGSIGRINLYGYLTMAGYTTVPDGLHYTADTYARMFQFLMQSIGKM